MSFSRNLVVSYLGQLYVAVLGILMVPLYIKYMGPEAYGLVGFFTMLQAWFSLLDMGLSGTLAREAARFHGGAMEALQFRRLLRALEGIFLAIALIGGLGFFAASGYIASDWLNAQSLPKKEVQLAVEVMGVVIAVRWMGGIYRSAITGAERLVWLGGYSSAMATLRFVGVLPVLAFLDHGPKTFFVYQLCVAVVEFFGLAWYAYRIIPGVTIDERVSWSWAPVKPLIRFSMTIAVTSSIWILATQTDKLLLSSLLPLAEYGYFSLAVLVASSVTILSAPFGVALMPRMARLEAERDHAGLVRVYRQTTQLVAVIAGATSVTMAFCATPLLWAWTGDQALAQEAAPILVLYALGNGILAVSAFPYYLQFAKGNLRLHLVGNIIFVLFMIPAIVAGTSKFGMIGAGYVWLGINCLSFVLWLPLVHQKFAPGLNRDWYLSDVLRIYLVIGLIGFILGALDFVHQNRIVQIIQIGGFGLLLLIAGAMASTSFWLFVRPKFFIR